MNSLTLEADVLERQLEGLNDRAIFQIVKNVTTAAETVLDRRKTSLQEIHVAILNEEVTAEPNDAEAETETEAEASTPRRGRTKSGN